jgi:hypothetical protein
MKHVIKHGSHTIEITTDRSDSSYGIPVLVVDDEVVMQIPLTKDERDEHAAIIRSHAMRFDTK